MIQGVLRHRLQAHADARGSFTEIWMDRWPLPIAPRQWALVHSTPGTQRGMHLHLRHDECVLATAGRMLVGLHDLRPDSPSSGHGELIELSAEVPELLVFPPGVVHGWYFPEGGTHLQAVSEPFAEYGEDDNLGCHWADPELGIHWPGQPTTLSPRAQAFPSLAQLREQISDRVIGAFAGA